MALLSLITGHTVERTKFQGQNGVDLMVVDAVLSFTPEYEAEVTEHPVEDDADITDHVRLRNVRITMEGVCSETPITLGASLAGAVSSIGGIVGAKRGALGNTIGAAAGGIGIALFRRSKTPDQEAREFLIDLIESRKTFSLWTAQRQYADLIMTSVQFPRDSRTGRALRFIAQMRQIRKARSQTVRLDNVEASVAHTATKAGKLGKKSAQVANQQKGRQSSIAFAGFQALGVIR